jgi:hypothetical protein
MIFALLLKKFIALYDSVSFITVFTRARHCALSCPRWIQSILFHTPILQDNFELFPSYALVFSSSFATAVQYPYLICVMPSKYTVYLTFLGLIELFYCVGLSNFKLLIITIFFTLVLVLLPYSRMLSSAPSSRTLWICVPHPQNKW